VSYWTKAAKSLGRNLRQREFARDWLSAGLRADSRLRASTTWITDVFPAVSGLPIDMGTVTYRPGNVTPFELFCLRAIAQLTSPARIFEFGTFDGATTLALAEAARGAQVWTLDLPDETEAPGAMAPVDLEKENRRTAGVGSRFAGATAGARITQLFGDSRVFDYSTYRGVMDLIFVDASHEEQFVRSDTDNALAMLAPGGVVIWHDYTAGWPGVRTVIDELAAREPVVHLELTSLALLMR
jgi:predicted O-methyltransferase YrrM